MCNSSMKSIDIKKKKNDNSLGLNQYVEIGNKSRWDRKRVNGVGVPIP